MIVANKQDFSVSQQWDFCYITQYLSHFSTRLNKGAK